MPSAYSYFRSSEHRGLGSLPFITLLFVLKFSLYVTGILIDGGQLIASVSELSQYDLVVFIK